MALRAPELLFRKIEDAEIEKQIEKLKGGPLPTSPAGGGQGKLAEANATVSKSNQPEALLPSGEERGGGAVKPEIVFDDVGVVKGQCRQVVEVTPSR